MNNRLHMTDYLRGVAALMVCLCHFRHSLPEVVRPPIYIFGTLGVQVFFVISGFIIPYSLAKTGYKISSLPRFLLKRLARLHPPLLAALALTFVLSHAASWVKNTGAPASFDLTTFWQTALYMRIPDENPVVWTLIVEAKYYLFIGLLYPVLFSHNARVRIAAFLVCALASATVHDFAPDLKHLPLFLMGFAACQGALGLTSRRDTIILALIAAASALPGLSTPQIIAGLATAALVTVPCGDRWKAGLFFGSISYSLYLIHFPVGVKFLNLTLPHIGKPWYMLMLPVAFALCVGVAALFWRIAENPAAQLSQKIRLSPRRPSATIPADETQLSPAIARKE